MSLRRLQLDTSWGTLTIAGGSRAGDGTLLVLPQLRLALDPGRPHRALPPMSTVCVSHGHMDHVGALGYWASQRFLNSMGRATALVPEVIAADVAELLVVLARLEGGQPYAIDVVAVAEGTRHPLRRDMDLVFFRTDHWVETLGVELVWRRRRLRPELHDRSEDEIAELRRQGHEVSEESQHSLLAYCADTGPGLLTRHPRLTYSEVLLLECSFFAPADGERARRFGHLHLDDLVALAPRLGCTHLVLVHASRRARLREVEALLEERLRPLLANHLHHLNVDWD